MFSSRSKAAPVRNFKKGLDNDDARRKREDNVISLRRTAREEHTQKRRVAGAVDAVAATSVSSIDLIKSELSPLSSGDIRDRLRDLPQLVAMLNCDIPEKQLEAAQIFRKLLSIEQNPPIQEVIDCGVTQRLVILLSFDKTPNIQFEAAWALTNIASGNSAQTRTVMDAGAIPAFVRLLSSPAEDVREQSVWALGNIAGDSCHCRDMVLREGAFPALDRLVVKEAKISLMRNAVWAMSNLCRGKPQPDFSLIAPCIPKLVAIITHMTDVEVLTDACWALSYISDDKSAENVKIKAVIAAGACPPLVKLLGHSSDKVKTPALRTVGNIVTGDDQQTDAILREDNVLAYLKDMARDSQKKAIRKEACWTLSNITAGSAHQINIVHGAGLFSRLIKLMSGSDYDVQKEACWAVSNATSGGEARVLKELADLGAFKGFIDVCENPDAKMILVALDGIENLLRAGKVVAERTNGDNDMYTTFEEADGLDTLEKLQTHENEEVYNRAIKILKEYCDLEAEGEQATTAELAPQTKGNTFAFGAPAPAASGDKPNPFGSSTFSFGSASTMDKQPAFSFGASTPAAAPATSFSFTAPPPVTNNTGGQFFNF